MPKTLPIVLPVIALILSGCGLSRVEATATERTLCRTWGESLPTRSRLDTAQTQQEISEVYADFAAACPDHAHLIP